MALSPDARNDPADVLRRLHNRLDAIQMRMRGQHAKGWQSEALATLRSDAAQLQDTASQTVADWGEAFTPLVDALHQASDATRLPTKAASTALLAATDDVRTRLPPLPEQARSVFAGQDPVRAEFPPAHYWRRWGATHVPQTIHALTRRSTRLTCNLRHPRRQ